MAVHVLTVLAYKQGDPVTSGLLAQSVNTNPVVIRRLLLALQHAKLVETRKGVGLGSRLSRSPSRINMAEVYKAVEDKKCFSLPRNKPNRACPVGNCIQSAIREVFSSAQNALAQDLARTTLAQILDDVNSCASEAGAEKK